MRSRKEGLLIHISSVGGRIVAPGQGIYGATKHALAALAETYRYELSPFGVDSILIEPFMYSGPDDVAREAQYVPPGDIGKRHSAFLHAALQSPTVGDPSELGEAILALIRTPRGSRPLHTVLPRAVGAGFQPLDSISDQIQRRAMERMGFGDLLEAH